MSLSLEIKRFLLDVVFVEFPNISDKFSQNDVFGTIEAVKTLADLYIPISGTIIEINESLDSKPELINSDAYKTGWIIKIKIENKSEIDGLLNPESYLKQIS